MGCMGMSYDDFCRCTPYEFKAIYDAWSVRQESVMEGDWERMRMLATLMLQPYAGKGKRITARKVLQLPWDSKHEAPAQDKESARHSFDSLMERRKKKENG